MVEMLLAAFIMAIGLLGLAALQVMAQGQGLKSRQLGTAALLAHNVLDLIQAEGSLTANERAISTSGAVGGAAADFVYTDPIGATATANAVAGPQFTILGLTTDDAYYTSHPAADKTVVFKTTYKRNTGTINTYAKTGVQEFVVNVTWDEYNNATKKTSTKSLSVSRYVRI